MGSPNEGTSIDGNGEANKNDTPDALPGGIAYVFSPCPIHIYIHKQTFFRFVFFSSREFVYINQKKSFHFLIFRFFLLLSILIVHVNP